MIVSLPRIHLDCSALELPNYSRMQISNYPNGPSTIPPRENLHHMRRLDVLKRPIANLILSIKDPESYPSGHLRTFHMICIVQQSRHGRPHHAPSLLVVVAVRENDSDTKFCKPPHAPGDQSIASVYNMPDNGIVCIGEHVWDGISGDVVAMHDEDVCSGSVSAPLCRAENTSFDGRTAR